jgi:tetratricopeptide (TPR) repeat protein
MALSWPAVDKTAVIRRSIGIEGRLALNTVLQRLTGRQSSTRLGRYELRQQLGAGGCGVVYTAWDPELGREVAIKLLLPAGDPFDEVTAARARLLREAQALARLRHRNVVEVFDVGVDLREDGRDRVYIVMELLAGETLDRWLEQRRPPWPTILARWYEVIAGVAAAHAVGIVHRDIKPANLMLTADGRVKVLDFGLARAEPVPTEPSLSGRTSADDADLTQTGLVLGTPRYMAPEQHAGQDVSPATDQFAICACLFEALYDRKAYAGATLDAIAQEKYRGPPARPRRTSVPSAIYDALARGMSPDPADRFDDVGALVEALRRGSRRGSPRIAFASVAVLAAAVGTAFLSKPPLPADCETKGFAWDATTQAAVQRGAVIADDPGAARAWSRVTSRVGAAAERFAATRAEACDADGAPSEAELEALACVVEAESEIGAALDDLQRIGRDSGDPRTALRRLWRWTGRRPCVGHAAKADPAVGREELDQIATELEDYGHRLSAERVETTLAFVERSLPRVAELGDATLRARLLELRGRTHAGAGHYIESAEAMIEAIWILEGEGDLVSAADLVPTALHQLIEGGAPRDEIDRLERLGLDLAARADEPSAASAELDVMRGLARIRRGDLDGAEPILLEAERVGLQVPLGEVATTRARLAISGVYMLRDEHDKAEVYAQRVLDDPPPVRGVRAGAIEEAHSRLGLISFFRGDFDAAQTHFTALIESIEGELGPEHPALAQPLALQAGVLLQRGDGDGAVAMIERARDLAMATVGWEHPMLGHILGNLVIAETSRGNLEIAEKIAVQVREHAALGGDANSREVIDAELSHAEILVDLQRYEEARPLLSRARMHYGEEISATLEHAEGRLALADGDPVLAEQRLRRALDKLDPAAPMPTDQGARGQVVWQLARARLAQGDGKSAAQLGVEARTLLRGGNPWQQARVSELDAWLATVAP